MAQAANNELRMPPHSPQAEESTLGSLLIDKDAIVKIADWLGVDDFYQGKHVKIYQAMLDVYSQGEPIDVLSVINRLKEKQQLQEVGGDVAVTHLATVVPTAGNVVHYARIVHKTATRRRLISAAADISEMGFQEEEDIDIIMDQAEKKLFSVSQSHKHQRFIALSEALEEAFTRIDQLHKGEHSLRGVTSGFRSIDNRMAGWQKADLIILAARPSVGKTALALDFARHAALNGVKVGIFSLEMSKDQLVDRLLAAHTHVDLWRLRTGKLESGGEFDDFSRLAQAMEELSSIPIYIDDHASANIMAMRTMARRLEAEHGLDLLIIDYLQLMESSRYVDNRVQEVSDISRNLKKLALELNVPIIALSQLSRAVEMRTNQRPRLSDLRESGSIEQDADVVLFLHRPPLNPDEQPPEVVEIDLLIEKHRNGPTGQVPLNFHMRHVTYREIDEARADEQVSVQEAVPAV
jgi:replicative DNA helicase